MAEHTPGVWTIDALRSPCRILGGNYAICELVYTGDYFRLPQLAADARLIAASPLLLAACEAEDEVDKHPATCDWCAYSLNCDIVERLKQDAWRLREIALAAVKGTVSTSAESHEED